MHRFTIARAGWSVRCGQFKARVVTATATLLIAVIALVLCLPLLGLARRLLELYPWWQFEPHQEWVEPSGSPEKINAPFAEPRNGDAHDLGTVEPDASGSWNVSRSACGVGSGRPGTGARLRAWDRSGDTSTCPCASSF